MHFTNDTSFTVKLIGDDRFHQQHSWQHSSNCSRFLFKEIIFFFFFTPRMFYEYFLRKYSDLNPGLSSIRIDSDSSFPFPFSSNCIIFVAFHTRYFHYIRITRWTFRHSHKSSLTTRRKRKRGIYPPRKQSTLGIDSKRPLISSGEFPHEYKRGWCLGWMKTKPG